MQEGLIFTSDECVVCMDGAATSTFGPCRHCCTCQDCSSLIRKQKMECPLCRSPIEGVLIQEEHIPAGTEELERFSNDRDAYLKRLHRPCAVNAGFVGKSKLARSVGAAMGDELEQRRLENAGTDRACAKPSKVTFEEDEEDAMLRITYKVGRRTVRETAPLIKDWDEVKAGLDGEQIYDIVELATYYPEAFWLCKYHKQSTSELISAPAKRQKK